MVSITVNSNILGGGVWILVLIIVSGDAFNIPSSFVSPTTRHHSFSKSDLPSLSPFTRPSLSNSRTTLDPQHLKNLNQHQRRTAVVRHIAVSALLAEFSMSNSISIGIGLVVAAIGIVISTIFSSSNKSSTANDENKKKSTSALSTSKGQSTTLSATTSSSNTDASDNIEEDRLVYDLAVIGGGVVGVSAALTASQEGTKKRNIILLDAPKESGALYNENTQEDLSLGGPTGLFSKALRDTSKRINVGTLRGMGLREDSVWNEIINSCVDLASSNAQDILRQLEMSKITYRRGFTTFAKQTDSSKGYTEVLVKNEDGSKSQIIKAERILVCTGSRPFLPKNVPFDGRRVFDSDSINTLKYLPKSIAITGSGIIAVEYAKIFCNLGADVTLIIRDKIPRNALMKIGLDKDVAALLVADLIRSGIKFVRGSQVKSFDVPPPDEMNKSIINNAPIKIGLEAVGGGESTEPTEIRCDAYLAAVGRVPNTKDLNLKEVGIDVDEYGGIVVDSRLCTSAPNRNIYAAGDVLGRPFLASIGVAQAKAAVTNMFDSSTLSIGLAVCEPDDLSCSLEGYSQSGTSFDPASLAANPFAFPTGVWSSPEVAYYGLSVEQCKDRGIQAGEGMSLYAECLRGRVFTPNGLLKLVYEKPAGRILGVHICGDDACELIHYGMELVRARRTVLELSQVMFSAVTFHEMYRIAAQAALDEAGARQRRAAAGRALAQRNRLVRDKALQ